MWVCKRCNSDQNDAFGKLAIMGAEPFCHDCFLEWEANPEKWTSDFLHAPKPQVKWIPTAKTSTVLEDAQGLIYGDRKEQYGNARTNFGDIGVLWSVVLGRKVAPEEVALCLLLLKVARAINDTKLNRPIKRDTAVDLAGYAGCIEKIQKGL